MSFASRWGRAPDPLRAVAAAEHALAQERAQLFAGDLAAVAESADRRAAEMAALDRLVGPEAAPSAQLAGRLEAFRARAARHAKLLEAAMAGTQAARRRLKAMDDARASLSGYDASGAPRAQTVNRVLGRKA